VFPGRIVVLVVLVGFVPLVAVVFLHVVIVIEGEEKVIAQPQSGLLDSTMTELRSV
jgi:hypothetical protein